MTQGWFGFKVLPPGKVNVTCPICRARLPVDADQINAHVDSHRVFPDTPPTLKAWALYRWRRLRRR